jgi:DNA/RNA-binding domain of Phe-tRNA-synthetase-like protein
MTIAPSLAIDPDVAATHPDYRAGVVIATGLVNGPSDETALAAAEATLLARGLDRAADDPHIAAWRAAFSAFGAKPSRYPSSAEALMSRVLRGDGLPRVNRLVDVYNAVSVEYAIPVGGEDLDATSGPIRLVRASGDEPFDSRSGEVEHPRAGEVVWRDDAGVTCRRWNWRQGQRTQLTDATTRAYFLFDALAPCSDDRLATAMDRLSALLLDACPGADLRTTVLRAA